MVVLLALFQVGLVVLATLWLWLGRPAGGLDLTLRLIAVWLLMAGAATAGLWLATPLSTVPLLGLVLLISSVASVVRLSSRPRSNGSWKVWPSRILAFGYAGVGLWAVVPAVAGWRTPPQVHDLRFPFDEGRYLVANGGSSERINGHFKTLAPRYLRWRGESYAVDLVRIERLDFERSRSGPFTRLATRELT